MTKLDLVRELIARLRGIGVGTDDDIKGADAVDFLNALLLDLEDAERVAEREPATVCDGTGSRIA